MTSRYEVQATLKFPCSYNTGYKMEICANSAAEAVKYARNEVSNMGHTRQDGPLSYKATKMEG